MTIDCRALVVASCLILQTSAYGSDQASLLVFPDDPEPTDGVRSLPTDQKEYESVTAGAESLGIVLAGRTEFPYLVDVRLNGRGQEDWTLGCLLSHKNVLVTCRWATFYLKSSRERNIDWGRKDQKERYRLNNPELTVYYAPLYINQLQNEYTLFWDYITVRERQGKRSVKFISTHPQCEEDAINYDFAVMTLARDIPPLVPYIGYMPIQIERNHLLITDFDLTFHEEKRIICHIASFGRNFANWKQHVTLDYKVKYRVYFENWASCTLHLVKYRCPSAEEDLPVPQGAYYTPHHCPSPLVNTEMSTVKFGKGFENLMCFNSRAKIGAVCDHDNGAPLVCDGKVYGVVTRGTHIKYCNDLLPVPFVVAKITPAADYYMTLARNPYTFTIETNADFSGRSFANMVKPSALFSLSSVTTFLFHVRI